MATTVLPPVDRADAEAAFLATAPSYRETSILDELRATEYARLDAGGETYLDYTGGSCTPTRRSRST